MPHAQYPIVFEPLQAGPKGEAQGESHRDERQYTGELHTANAAPRGEWRGHERRDMDVRAGPTPKQEREASGVAGP